MSLFFRLSAGDAWFDLDMSLLDMSPSFFAVYSDYNWDL